MISFGQSFEIRTTDGDEGYLHVQMRETSGTGTPQTSNQLTDIVFQVKWLQSLGNVDLGSVICTNYEITKSGTRSTQTTFYYQEFYANNTPFAFPENWTQNTWYTIATLEVGTGSGSGTFQIGANDFVGTGVNIGVDLNDYTPVVNGEATNYSYPTIVYDLVWKGGFGGFENDWFFSSNWETTCGSAAASGPNSTLNVYIPDVSGASGYFPSTNLAGTMACKNLRIASGAQLNVPELNGLLIVSEQLLSIGTLFITPNANATINGSTYFGSAEGLVVQSTSSGIGSFIDNGTITYGASGSAKVQTYLSNSAGVGNFDIHLIGPTVDEENYTGGGTGAFLSAFSIDASTYAYEWDETVALVNGWNNISSNSFEVRTANGIGLSTIDNTNHTLEMTGNLITGDVSSPSLTFSNNHYELISNPYPSSIDFDGLASDNSSVVNNKYWIWNPSSNSYVERAGGSGGTQYIQVGQAFFVETNSVGTFDFTNSRREHSTDPFRNNNSNILTITAFGGMEGYEDIAIIRFDEDATSGYDVNMEAEFWESQNSDATSLRSVTDDNLELAINVLPTESLIGKEMLSVPLKFDCGYTTEYTLNFADIESFEYGTEIYLEDTKSGEDWILINENPVYTFTAAEYQGPDRFILHFFGPTGIEEAEAISNVDIFSSGQHAYVRNNSDENINMIYVYNLASELVMSTKLAKNQKFTRFWVSDQVGYYIVKVITNENIYTEKVLIFK